LFEVSDERRKRVWTIPASERLFFERSGHSLEFFASFWLQGKKEVGVTGVETPFQNLKCLIPDIFSLIICN
jgi:hypothetical protein